MGDEGTTSEHKGWSLLTGSPLPAVLVIVGVGAVIGLMLSIGRSSSAGAESFGVIYVDSPEVNTRERLLNDRLVQEQWLNAELARTDREFGVQGVHDRSEASGIHAGASFAGPASSAPPLGSAPVAAAPAASARPAVKVSEIDAFRDGLAFREEVRSELIENQLDDRHDMDGSTLYRLKFDVTVLPGEETRARAIVAVRLTAPLPPLARGDTSFDAVAKRVVGNPEVVSRLPALRSLYDRWLIHLGKTVNHSLVECRDEVRKSLDCGLLPCRDIDEAKVTTNADDGAPPPTKQAAEPTLPSACDGGLEKTLRSFYASLLASSGTRSALKKKDPESFKECTKPQDPDDIAFFSRCLLTFDKKLELDETTGRDFQKLFADWFIEQSSDAELFSQAANFAAVSASDDGQIVVGPRREELAFYPDASEKQRLEAALKELREKLLGQRPELVLVDGISSAEIDAGGPYRPSKRVVRIRREFGFTSFLSTLLTGSNRLYTYAVTPKESAQRVSNALSERDTLSALLRGNLAAATASNSSTLERSYDLLVRRDAIERSPLVVGFSDDLGGRYGEDATFGWIFGPRYRLGEHARDQVSFRQTTTQQAVSVIIAAPAWWTDTTMAVDAYWQKSDGSCVDFAGKRRPSCVPFGHPPPGDAGTKDAGTKGVGAASAPIPSSLTVRLPGDQETLSDVLLDVPRRPEIYRREMGRQRVVVGKTADIVIPGRYLWRSSKVSLGTQVAARISVLPDMRGIIAHFTELQEPPELAEKNSAALKLTVWTSDGQDSVGEHVVLVRRRPESPVPAAPSAVPPTPAPK